MSTFDDYSPTTLARVTPWSRDQWQQVYDLVAADERLDWDQVVQAAIKTGEGPRFVNALIQALVPKPIQFDP